MVVFDAHVHADPSRNPGVLDDLDVGGLLLEGILVVPPNDAHGDDAWAIDLAARAGGAVGVVVRAPFAATADGVAALAAGAVPFTGVRVVADRDDVLVPPPLASVAAADRVVVHVQNPTGRWDAVGRAVAAHPDRTFAIDHLGHPPVDEGVDAAPWRDFLALARHDNVFVKFPNIAFFAGSLQAAPRLVPFVAEVLAAFGDTRLVWASDWPRTGDAAYPDLVEAGAGLLDACGADHDVVFGHAFHRMHGRSVADA